MEKNDQIVCLESVASNIKQEELTLNADTIKTQGKIFLYLSIFVTILLIIYFSLQRPSPEVYESIGYINEMRQKTSVSTFLMRFEHIKPSQSFHEFGVIFRRKSAGSAAKARILYNITYNCTKNGVIVRNYSKFQVPDFISSEHDNILSNHSVFLRETNLNYDTINMNVTVEILSRAFLIVILHGDIFILNINYTNIKYMLFSLLQYYFSLFFILKHIYQFPKINNLENIFYPLY